MPCRVISILPRLGLVEVIFDTEGKPCGKSLVVAADDDTKLWVLQQPPGGILYGDKLALSMPRRHKDHQPLDLARGHLVQYVDDVLQVLVVPLHVGKGATEPSSEWRMESGKWRICATVVAARTLLK